MNGQMSSPKPLKEGFRFMSLCSCDPMKDYDFDCLEHGPMYRVRSELVHLKDERDQLRAQLVESQAREMRYRDVLKLCQSFRFDHDPKHVDHVTQQMPCLFPEVDRALSSPPPPLAEVLLKMEVALEWYGYQMVPSSLNEGKTEVTTELGKLARKILEETKEARKAMNL